MLPGSLPGTLLGKVLPKTRKEQLPTMFWLCSIGVNSVIKASGMTAVVLALLVGLYFLISGLQHKSATIHCQKIAQTPPPKQDFVGRGRSFYSFIYGNTAQFPPYGLSTALAAACITVGGSNLLLDCGEGTQTAARRAGVSIFRMDAILLTHYHGDHIFGLPGIWQTMAAQGRTAPLVMAGPPGLTDVVRTFYAVAGPLPFELRLKELPDCKGEFEVPAGCVQAFPLKHRVPCCGYAFTLPRAGKFDPQRAKAAGIPVRYWSTLQSGQPVGGFLPSQVLGPPRRGLKVVYATDTRPCAALRRAAQDADLLLMDSTYADDADLPKAKLYGHSTCRETGVLAAEANVCRLWLTHYSAAVTDLAPGLAAAQQAFPTAAAGVDGMRLTLNFDPD